MIYVNFHRRFKLAFLTGRRDFHMVSYHLELREQTENIEIFRRSIWAEFDLFFASVDLVTRTQHITRGCAHVVRRCL